MESFIADKCSFSGAGISNSVCLGLRWRRGLMERRTPVQAGLAGWSDITGHGRESLPFTQSARASIGSREKERPKCGGCGVGVELDADRLRRAFEPSTAFRLYGGKDEKTQSAAVEPSGVLQLRWKK